MKKLIFFVLLLCVFDISQAQTTSDSLFVRKNFWGIQFYQNNIRLNFNQLPQIMEHDQEASTLIRKARGLNVLSSVIGGLGGFLVGWQLGTSIAGGDPNWAVAGVGGGLIVISIPIYSKSYKQSLEAIDIYNSGLSAGRRPTLRLGATPDGVRLAMRF